MADPQSPSILQGTLDLLVLKALSLQPLHGLGVARRIEQISRGTFQVGAGSLFPALHRLERAGAVVSTWGTSETNRRAKFYRLTAAGERRLAREEGEWRRIAAAMTAALEAG